MFCRLVLLVLHGCALAQSHFVVSELCLWSVVAPCVLDALNVTQCIFTLGFPPVLYFDLLSYSAFSKKAHRETEFTGECNIPPALESVVLPLYS